MALNRVILFGRLTKDPEHRKTTSGVSVCRFTVACDRQFANKESGKREADFIEVQAWRNTADFVARYFVKGNPITVEGSIRNNNYEDKNGVKHFSYVIVADNVGFAGSKEEQSSDTQTAPAQNEEINLDEFEVLGDGEVPF